MAISPPADFRRSTGRDPLEAFRQHSRETMDDSVRTGHTVTSGMDAK